jgi:hypothetical protein
MSLESIFSSAIGQRVGQQLGNTEFDLHTLILGLNELNKSIKSLADQTPKAFIFLKGPTGLSSNVNANVNILAGPQIPQGYKATIKDFNLIFSTAAGTVRLVIMDANYNIIQPLLTDITSTTNGLGETVLEENQRLAVVGQTAGAGTFTVYCSGILQKNVPLETQ